MKYLHGDWTRYEAEGDDYISPEKWGKDHWSTFAYLESCAVDRFGMIDNRHMRCHPRLHRQFVGLMPGGGIQDGSQYPTRLNDGTELGKHDDWSCLEDMVAAELIAVEWRMKDDFEAFGCGIARVKFTDKGLEVASALRRHKSEGGQSAQFRMEPA